uniref:PA domain-containing protein n=1 Tax=Gallus gallus TaxID=9031 RepID=A0A8V1ABC0_CHICK
MARSPSHLIPAQTNVGCHVYCRSRWRPSLTELLWPPARGLMGYLMRAIPPNACHTMLNPPAPRKASEKYIALIQGCDCPYAEKVLRAQQAGYQAAVVYNVDSEELMSMMSDDKEIQQQIKIPSLFTGESVSLHLQKTFEAFPVLSLSSCSRLLLRSN